MLIPNIYQVASNKHLNKGILLNDTYHTELKLRVRKENLIFLFLNQNICCGYSKELSQGDGSFEHPKHMLKRMGKKIFTFLRGKFLFI